MKRSRHESISPDLGAGSKLFDIPSVLREVANGYGQYSEEHFS
jgi:hypothetical protein